MKIILTESTQEVDKSAIDAPVLRGKGGGAVFCGEAGLRAAAAYETRGETTTLPPPPSSSARPFGVLACPLLQPTTTFTLPSFFILPCFSSLSAATKKIMFFKRNCLQKLVRYHTTRKAADSTFLQN